MIHGDTLSRLLGGSSLADCKVKTEPAETGKVLSLLLYFSTRTFNFFFPIWKCSWGAGKGRLANSRGLREETLCPCRAVSLIESGSSAGRPAPKPARLPGPPPLSFSLPFGAGSVRPRHVTLATSPVHQPRQPPGPEPSSCRAGSRRGR